METVLGSVLAVWLFLIVAVNVWSVGGGRPPGPRRYRNF